MLIKLHWVLSALLTGLTVWLGDLLSPWAALWIPLLFIGYSIAIHALHIVIAFFWSLFLDPECKIEKVNPIYRFMVVETVRIVLIFGKIFVRVEGKEKLPKDKDEHFLLVSNHLSRFDPMVALVHLAEWPTAFVSKPENFKIPIAGRFVHMCHYLAIDREDPRAAISTIREATEIVRSGEQNVGIYPEGTRSTDGKLLPFHDGVFMIAAKARCGVAVATVKNTDRIAQNFPFGMTRVTIRIVRYLTAEELAGKRSGEISAMVREIMERALGEERA